MKLWNDNNVTLHPFSISIITRRYYCLRRSWHSRFQSLFEPNWPFSPQEHWMEKFIELNFHWIEFSLNWISIELNVFPLNWIFIELNVFSLNWIFIELNIISLNCIDIGIELNDYLFVEFCNIWLAIKGITKLSKILLFHVFDIRAALYGWI